MQNTEIYKFFPNIGIQNINIRKLNKNFESLSTDSIHFSIYEDHTISTGSKGFIYIPCNIWINGWVVGAFNTASLVIDLRKCSSQDYPNTTSFVGSNKIILSNVSFSENSSLSDWDNYLEEGNWLEVFVESALGTSKADIILKINR